jgi:hypothetical protein
MMTSRLHQQTKRTPVTARRSWCVLSALYLDCLSQPASSEPTTLRSFAIVNQEAGT